jgi:hypothetical protein
MVDLMSLEPRFAFIVLSHNNPGQLLRLIKALMKLYENPTIVCHHNFTMCPLDQNEFPTSCLFLQPHINTGWGEISLVRAFGT